MLKKLIVGFVVFSMTTLFGMSLSALNKASKSDLMEINGIGEVKAKAIMKARPFKSMADVSKVKGVGAQLVSNIKNDVKLAKDVKKVKKTTKKKTKSKTDAKTDTKTKKKRKIKSADEKKKELKTKAKKTKDKKTKEKKTKTKKTKEKKEKTKN
ncbi:MAG: Unknown protein [uncultured Sulfurovum sp.]|uniref:Helix-hairpin-helix DNA-binding motif class 1 domain-containing protein n=1 Tax=uncultured Sulfurovum sp. TaxID=269237 RepID=A0A6S6TBX6_9BACT|nr:MAG: Unknown protein [uncultured Sulfurovum sp.]